MATIRTRGSEEKGRAEATGRHPDVQVVALIKVSVPAGDEHPEQRDGFRIVRLVMSIIYPHIVSEKPMAGAGGVRGGAQPFPAWRGSDGLGV